MKSGAELRQVAGTGLFVRGSGFSAEQIQGYNRDLSRLLDFLVGGCKEDPIAAAAARERAAASERVFRKWDRNVR